MSCYWVLDFKFYSMNHNIFEMSSSSICIDSNGVFIFSNKKLYQIESLILESLNK